MDVSAYDPSLQFFERVVSPDNVLCSSCGVGIIDRIYPVIPDTGQKPDDSVQHKQCDRKS
jgi:hypothetical protein